MTPAVGGWQALAPLWASRGLVRALVAREWRNRFVGSVLGMAWAVLQPVLLLATYALVFQFVFQVRPPLGEAGPPYLVWVAVTLWPWLAFSEALVRGSGAVVAHAALVKKVALPRSALVLSAVWGAMVWHGIGYALVLLALWALGWSPGAAVWPVALWAWCVLGIAAFGLALGLSALHVFIRDVEPVLAQCVTLLFYASPVLYPLALVPAGLARVMAWNPLVHVLEPLRAAALGLPLANGWGWLAVPVGALLVLWAGASLFQRLQPFFEDQL